MSTIGKIDPIDVTADNGDVVGRIGRGEIAGTEGVGTFRFDPAEGRATILGITSFKRSWIKRLLRPDYIVIFEDKSYRLVDKLGENLVYFAVSGDLGGHHYLARQDWDDSVEVSIDGQAAARWIVGELLGQVRIDVSVPGPISGSGTLLFGVTMLLPFMQMIHRDESELIESFLG